MDFVVPVVFVAVNPFLTLSMNTIAEHHHLFWQDESPLVCVERIEETRDAATFVLAEPARRFFHFLPGQFVSVGAVIDGKTHWRAYSISSSPARPETLSITAQTGGRRTRVQLATRPPARRLRDPCAGAGRRFRAAPRRCAVQSRLVLGWLRRHADDVDDALVAGNPGGRPTSISSTAHAAKTTSFSPTNC